MAGITTLLCLLVAVPIACYIAGQSPTRKAILVYLITLPFWVSMILRVYAWMIILGRDGTLIEAAHDLYGNRWLTLRRVILPLTAPGLVSGAILVFVPSLGAVLEPRLMGGGKQMMMGSLIQMQFTSARNWPFGAAIAITLLVFVMIVLILSARRATSKETTA